MSCAGGFFGPTNFGAIWKENQANLGSHEDFQISNEAEPRVATSESLQAQTLLMIAGAEYRGCSQRVALGVKILSALPDKQTVRFLLEWYRERGTESVLHKPSVMAWAEYLFTKFADELEERDPECLERISKMICENNKLPCKEECDDYSSWVQAYSGENLRWEAVGTVIAELTHAILSIPERDCFFCSQEIKSRKDRRGFAMEMKDLTQACVTLSNYGELINMQMVALLGKNMHLQTILSGDTSASKHIFVSCAIAKDVNRSSCMATAWRSGQCFNGSGIAPRECCSSTFVSCL